MALLEHCKGKVEKYTSVKRNPIEESNSAVQGQSLTVCLDPRMKTVLGLATETFSSNSVLHTNPEKHQSGVIQLK